MYMVWREAQLPLAWTISAAHAPHGPYAACMHVMSLLVCARFGDKLAPANTVLCGLLLVSIICLCVNKHST